MPRQSSPPIVASLRWGSSKMSKKKKKPKGQLPSGSFNKLVYVGKRADGSRRYESFTADSPEAAQAEASAFKLRARELRRQGVAVEDIPRDDTPVVEHHGITLGEAMDAFIETCRTQGYSPATIPAYKAVRNNSFPHLINKPVDTITLPDVQDALNRRAADHAIKTVRNDYFFIKKVLRIYAPDLNLSNITLAKTKKPPRQRFKQAWAADILKYASENECVDFYIYASFTISAGLRPSETYALTWADISAEPITMLSNGDTYSIGLIHVSGAAVRDEYGIYTAKGTKTDAGARTLSVDWAFFEDLYSRRPRGEGRIVQITPGNLKKRWARVRTALGLPEKMRFYDLRHFYATAVATSGATEDELAERMGHSTSAFSHSVYVELFEDRQERINAELAKGTRALYAK